VNGGGEKLGKDVKQKDNLNGLGLRSPAAADF
jgi:hypothetical protein